MDGSTLESALAEPLPDAPYPLPNLARQLVEAQPRGEETRTGIDLSLQRQVEDATTRWSDELALTGTADLAAVILDIRSGETIAYVGNASPLRTRHGSEVDIAASPRSTGSILKPFLYCAALQDGTILPRTLLRDTPVNLNGFTPQNFDLQFHGAVPAAEALARSLNVPAVHLLRAYGPPRFLKVLRDAGLTTLPRDASYYGLSLILGGGEGTLADITRAYADMVRSYDGLPTDSPFRDRLALWYTFEALKEVNRPDEIDWKLIRSVRKAAWKTGTSYGSRDAWAVGVTPDYAVGVWCGNADARPVRPAEPPASHDGLVRGAVGRRRVAGCMQGVRHAAKPGMPGLRAHPPPGAGAGKRSVPVPQGRHLPAAARHGVVLQGLSS